MRNAVAILVLLFAVAAAPVGPAEVTLSIRLLPLRSCVDERGLQMKGSALRVGGAQVTHSMQRSRMLDASWSLWTPVRVPFHEVDGKFDTRVKVVYGSDLEPVEVVSTEDTGGVVIVTLRNARRATSMRVYVGDNADFARLDCVVDNGALACDNIVEV